MCVFVGNMFNEIRFRSSLPCFVLAALAVAGCASPAESGASASEDEVITARCPSSLTVKLEQPHLFKNVPKKYFDGSPLSANEQGRTKAVMDDARSLGVTTLKVEDLVKKSGTCTYSSGPDTRVVLRTKGGKDRMDIFHKAYRIYAFPTSYDRDGVTFATSSSVGFFANVAASGPFDGGSLNVRIGTTVVTSTKAPSPPAGVTTLRVPVLDENGTAFEPTVAAPKTIELDGATGPAKYTALATKLSSAGFDMMQFASPDAYETADPATTICFGGPETGVCDLLPRFTDNLLGDMFSIAQNDDEALDCKATANAVKFSYFISESDHVSTATIPRCK